MEQPPLLGIRPPRGIRSVYGTAYVNDDATITPESGTLTLMGIAGIACIAGIGFRQHLKRKKSPVTAGSALA